jgi:hypothetical protein
MIAVRIDDAHAPAFQDILPYAVLQETAFAAPDRTDHVRMLQPRDLGQHDRHLVLIEAKDDRRAIERRSHCRRSRRIPRKYLGAERFPPLSGSPHRAPLFDLPTGA